MKTLRNFFIIAALAGIAAVAARKLGLIGGEEDDEFDFVFDDVDEGSADGGEDDAAE